MATFLDNDHYFGQGGFPIAVYREGQTDGLRKMPDFTEVEHSHSFWEIILINGGHGQHWLEGQSFPVSTGDVFLIQKKQKHYFHDLYDLELVNVLYDPDLLSLPESELRKLPGYR